MEEASQVGDVGVETGEVAESTGTEATTETADDTTSFVDEGSDLAAINLDGLREKYGEAHPELVDFAKSLQGDYTKKTQEAAGIKRAYDQYAQQLQTEHDAKMAQMDPSNLPNFDTLSPEQTAQWLVQNITDNLKGQIDQRIGPMQDQLQASQYDQQISALEQANPLFADEMIRSAAADVAGQGLTAETAFKAAAFDRLTAENTKLKNAAKTKTAGAIGQAGVSATDVSTKPTAQKGMSWPEVKKEMERRESAGEL